MKRAPDLVTVNGADLYTAASLAGMGIVQLPRYRVLQELNEKKLVSVLPGLLPPPIPVSVLYPQSRHLSQRVRVFVDWISNVIQSIGQQ